MKEIVIKYLDKQYRFTLNSYVSYKLYDKVENKDVGLREVLSLLPTIFDINQEEISQIFDEWADRKAIELNNRVTEIRYMLYEKTGLELELTTNDLNRFIEAYEMGEQESAINQYTPYIPVKE